MNILLFEGHETDRPLSRRDARAVHLIKVLHKKPGDFFDAGVLGGMLCAGKIESITDGGDVVFSLRDFSPPLPRAKIRVGVGWARPVQLRRLLRDLSSMGVCAVDLFSAELGEKSYRDTNLVADGGARAALMEGAVQARDTVLPELGIYVSLDAWLAARPWENTFSVPGGSVDGNFSGGNSASGNAPLLVAADNVRPSGTFSGIAVQGRAAALAIGPERGFSDREREMLEQAGFARLSLGPRALRTETACVAATALLLEKMGDNGLCPNKNTGEMSADYAD